MSLKDEFDTFLAACVAPEANDVQVSCMKDAFFAGALVVVDKLMKAQEGTEEFLVNGIISELGEYQKAHHVTRLQDVKRVVIVNAVTKERLSFQALDPKTDEPIGHVYEWTVTPVTRPVMYTHCSDGTWYCMGQRFVVSNVDAERRILESFGK